MVCGVVRVMLSPYAAAVDDKSAKDGDAFVTTAI